MVLNMEHVVPATTISLSSLSTLSGFVDYTAVVVLKSTFNDTAELCFAHNKGLPSATVSSPQGVTLTFASIVKPHTGKKILTAVQAGTARRHARKSAKDHHRHCQGHQVLYKMEHYQARECHHNKPDSRVGSCRVAYD
ncbi:hypothetical protein M378DRAFT_198845 [Amanita muscaria Koide BX008]|uniref:Uncharacterized protein n=1 Tax=Amanita muscaria (strain Koide BX008) TaxID=946122 RepID=A0A0C2WNY5_AMAMK|nr:hypothetical protein M378DRAFT_198845 [Amanita muscaria Koide BX008]